MFRTAREFASPGTAFPGYPHALSPPRKGAGEEREAQAGWEGTKARYGPFVWNHCTSILGRYHNPP